MPLQSTAEDGVVVDVGVVGAVFLQEQHFQTVRCQCLLDEQDERPGNGIGVNLFEIETIFQAAVSLGWRSSRVLRATGCKLSAQSPP